MKRSVDNNKKRFTSVLLLVSGLALLAGCSHVKHRESERPWAQSQTWENGLPSTLYEGR